MTRKIFLGAAMAASVACLNARENSKGRLNILCITCEDISPRVGCFGDTVAVTPNLDAFSEHAVRCTNMFTTVGVSAPSRSALITGMYPTAIGSNYMRSGDGNPAEGVSPYEVVPDAGIKCYTEYLRAAGYYCTNNDKTDYQFRSPLTAWDENGKSAHWRNRPEGSPFFAVFNLGVTHESQIWERQDMPLKVAPEDIAVPPYFPDDPVVRHDMAVMYSNIAVMDWQFGRLLDELEADGLADNTVIMWFSDNGGPLPREKRAIYESGMKVPFMISFPDGYRAGDIDENMYMFPDIPATILSIAGICPPDYMQGRAFYGEYINYKPREYVYGARNRMDDQVNKQGAVRDSNFRYVRNYTRDVSNFRPTPYRMSMPMMRRMLELLQRDSLEKEQMRWFVAPVAEEEFYVLSEDPYELHNRIADPAYQKDIERMRNEFDRWIDEECPRWKQSEAESWEYMWPGGKQPAVPDPVIDARSGHVRIASELEGVSFAYQINGKGYSEDHWFLYSEPLRLHKGDVLTVIGCRAGMKDSRVVTYTCR